MKRLNVLVVDDSQDVLAVTMDSILRLGHLVTPASNAQAALDYCHGTKLFDVLITDLQMPGMSGIELIQELGKLSPEERPRRMFLYTGTRDITSEDTAPLAKVIYKPAMTSDWSAILSEE